MYTCTAWCTVYIYIFIYVFQIMYPTTYTGTYRYMSYMYATHHATLLYMVIDIACQRQWMHREVTPRSWNGFWHFGHAQIKPGCFRCEIQRKITQHNTKDNTAQRFTITRNASKTSTWLERWVVVERIKRRRLPPCERSMRKAATALHCGRSSHYYIRTKRS